MARTLVVVLAVMAVLVALTASPVLGAPTPAAGQQGGGGAQAAKQHKKHLIVGIAAGASCPDTMAAIKQQFFAAKTAGGPPQRKWKMERFDVNNVTAVAIPGDSDLAQQIRNTNMPGVWRVDEEVEYQALDTEKPAPFGLDRIDSHGRIDGQFDFTPTDGTGVTAYVIDTGVDVNHPNFEGRAQIKDFTGEGAFDGNGHGTHVSGTIASQTFGISRKAKIMGLKVLSSSGKGSNVLVLRALQFVSQSMQKSGGKGVINMSLGGPRSGGQGDANIQRSIQALTQMGVPVVVAAGNEAQDACNTSPAFVKEAITVSASDQRDGLASFSNFGSCTDIIAPGVNVQSLKANSNGGTAVLSGTSMATPHVAGVVAALLSRGANPADIPNILSQTATQNAISGNLRGTPNRLLFLDPSGSASNSGGGGSNNGGGSVANPPARLRRDPETSAAQRTDGVIMLFLRDVLGRTRSATN
ncbi:hypothetical protein RI367_007109 [Sorochytrium milnesiophthora]